MLMNIIQGYLFNMVAKTLQLSFDDCDEDTGGPFSAEHNLFLLPLMLPPTQ